MAKHTVKRAIEVVCESCGSTFITGSSIKHYCSPECRIRKAAESFPDPEQCWNWAGSINPQTGYGQLSQWEDGKRILLTAHRVSFRAFCGSIPDGQQVLHRCDNRRCFNPAHLFAGSQADNMQDMIEKGRGGPRGAHRGSKHHKTRLTDADALAIRVSTDTLAVLSAKYGMSQSALSGIRTGRTWSHLVLGEIRSAIDSTDSLK